MAKKRSTKTKTSVTPERRMLAVTMKGSEEWKGWLEEAAKHCRISVSSLIDLSVTEYVKARGFKKEPPER